MFVNWLAPGASVLSRFVKSQVASVTWCQFAIRIDSIRCCKTWLAQAASRAIWIVSMAEEFIRKREPRNKADTAVAMVHSTKAKPVCSALERRSIVLRRQHLTYRIMEIITPFSTLKSRLSADRFRAVDWPFVANHFQVLAIIAAGQLIDNLPQIRLRNKFHPQCDFFETRHLESLTMLNSGDVIAGFEETRLRSGIEPGH